MTVNKPEIVAYVDLLRGQERRYVSLRGGVDQYSLNDGDALIRLSEYEALQAKYVALVEALEQIERWDGFPSTDKTWEGSGEPVSYGAAFGSNGERDFMREVARKALAAHRKQQEGEA